MGDKPPSKTFEDWSSGVYKPFIARRPERRASFASTSGFETPPLPSGDISDANIGYPGEYPFTRGVQPSMYRGRLWTMRQYAGFSTAKATNERYKFLLAGGQTGLSVASELGEEVNLNSLNGAMAQANRARG